MRVVEGYVTLELKTGKMQCFFCRPAIRSGTFPGVVVFAEIYQVTGPIERFCRKLACEGYLVISPESYHEYLPLGTKLAYDKKGTETGNALKIKKAVAGYDIDAKACLAYLKAHPRCNGSFGAVGICMGGHLAFRCALEAEVKATCCLFATDLQNATLGDGGDDSLKRCKEIKGEIIMIHGRQDRHVPPDGRDKIRKALTDANVDFAWYEPNAKHAFVRDELSKGRFDFPIAKICEAMMLEMFQRKLQLGLGSREDEDAYAEFVPLAQTPAPKPAKL
mmetsp:Transcript_1714/g.3131  ORF Transcript_1714/g.3131 Transcript_1714/m.3131 type:complete len:277 (-) Transcript_1714:447-1277(-)|eukprot:CAMPEP_0197531092 /NCGR_PEP_ID=MMETSP1318-20131121/33988_1 /TAXON_ID=552666 /ORGANISM="Partenskyella glossopodia, Strain RCC365" /LENGTH=276 /DNA_ID=CAMNT_0043087177 /DNA_START=38 /DNA_END=868 /DNA_ORIENTATION=+